MLDGRGNVRLTDFGLTTAHAAIGGSSAAAALLSAAGGAATSGMSAYRAPELWDAGKHTPESVSVF